MEQRPHVALLIESSRAYGRGLLRGIARYVRLHTGWSLLHHERALGDSAPPWLTRDTCDGVIARIESPELLATLRRLRIPAVDLRGLHSLADIPLIETDEHAVAQLAAEHLLERGFRNYAYCGFPGVNYSARRLKYFAPRIREAGVGLDVFGDATPPTTATGGDTTAIEAHELMGEDGLRRWLAGLPKPVGLFACNDIRGQQVLNACRTVGIRVPHEVAVLGVDNDDVLCELADPPLSSVVPNTEGIGWAAAAMLERLMRGEVSSQQRTFVAPTGIVCRASTDVRATDDREVAAALHFIRTHACEGINVEDVLQSLAVSRSTLDRRFASVVGHSPKEEIVRARLGRVKQLLLETDYTVKRIAQVAGFEHHEHLSVLFKSRVGVTPGAFRTQGRATQGGAVQGGVGNESRLGSTIRPA